jgi:hypothetical protein
MTMRFLGNEHYGLCNDAFAGTELSMIRSAVLASPLLGANRLAATFEGSRGFSLVFTRDGIAAVRAEHPYLADFIDRALRPSCNAFYLNPLLLQRGSAVGPHVDCSLARYLGEPRTPFLVSVLYVEVPDDLDGGELVLCDGELSLARITPRAGTLLYFAGRLRHHVTSVDTTTTRMSLVCEQYKLPPDLLAAVPTFEAQPGLTYERSRS